MTVFPWILIFPIASTAVVDADIRVYQTPENGNTIAGGNITLYCSFHLFKDNSDVTVYWWKLGENEFLQSVNDSRKRFLALKKGKASLQLLNVSAADSGGYCCGLKHPDSRMGNGTCSKLVIYVPPTPLRIECNDADPNASATLILVCKTAEFYPNNLNITWSKDGVKVESGINAVIQINEKGLSEVSSFLKESQPVKSGTVYSCQATHLTGQTATDFRFISRSTEGRDNALWYIKVYGSAGGGIIILLLLIIIRKGYALIICKAHSLPGTGDSMEQPPHPEDLGTANAMVLYAALDLTKSMKTASARYQEERTVYAQTKQVPTDNNLTYAALELAVSRKTEKPKVQDKSSEYAQLHGKTQRVTAEVIYTSTKIT